MAEAKKEEKTKAEEHVVLNGLVVDWTLPSKESLVDWLRETVEDVRVKEVVELFPKEIFNELENIRRVFYYRLEKLTIPTYSLKVLPAESLPRFQEAVEATRKALERLDENIKEALKSNYTQKALSYYEKRAERKPRFVDGVSVKLSERFKVFLMPLKIDRMLWNEFLNEQMEKELQRIREAYQIERHTLNQELEAIKKQIDEDRKELESMKRELAEAQEEVEKAYEGVKVPVDVALLKTEKAELEGKVKDLKAKARDLELKIQRLERDQREREEGFTRARVWAGQQTEQTERRMRFDAWAVMNQQLRELLEEALKALEEPDNVKDREFKRLEKVARNAMERVRSVMPASRMAEAYERLFIAVKSGASSQYEEAKEQLESLRREI